MHRIKAIQENLIDCVECQMKDLEHVDTCELGEVIDMIKDCEEMRYYCAKIEKIKAEMEPCCCSAHRQEILPESKHMGHSHITRCIYIDSRDAHADKTARINALTQYVQELTSEVMEMIDGAAAEEQQLLEKRINMLATKIAQLNS